MQVRRQLFKGGRPPCTDHGGVNSGIRASIGNGMDRMCWKKCCCNRRGHIVASEITGIIVVYISTQNCTREDIPFRGKKKIVD